MMILTSPMRLESEVSALIKFKLQNIEDIDHFFKVVDSCSGPVTLIGDDIQLNLKSKLSQYFNLAKLFSDGNIPELEIEVENYEDANKMIRFMMG